MAFGQLGKLGARGGFGSLGVLGGASGPPIPEGYTLGSDGLLYDSGLRAWVYTKDSDGAILYDINGKVWIEPWVPSAPVGFSFDAQGRLVRDSDSALFAFAQDNNKAFLFDTSGNIYI